ncbi:conserved hypothetical protein [Candidatus Desulfarcum epimagneticum]|uniref:Cytosolic protein n=1 Tax=uncultured Desulfobacteraceae bacterium TaxID=218296 RepID=A0A484HDJ2_9BACT|nr:conserved hypothetical protein [uncultured Desulfobacteraceae bacterium]
MECAKEKNLENCNCTYEPCAKKGLCCQCVQYHLKSRQVPGCFFPDDAEATWNRSFDHFADLVSRGRV